MTYGELKTKVLDYLHRTEITGVSGGVDMTADIINIAKSNLERGTIYIGNDALPRMTPKWPHMLSKSTGVLTASVDYIALPTRFQEVKRMSLSKGNGTEKTLTSLTQAAGIATATYTNHGYSVGDRVIISGANQSGYLGVRSVLTAAANTFTFAVDSSTVSPATGTIIAEKEAKQIPLTGGIEWDNLIVLFPYGPYSKGTPQKYAYVQEDSLFRVRPFPDDVFAYELVSYIYTADFSADSDSNFWTTTGWDVLLFASLVHASTVLRADPAQWQAMLNKSFSSLADRIIDENYSGHLNMSADVVM